jgi:4-methyl-5(b-hydroxyethyl)-thiazole monophosphate biosynthesis
MLRKQKEEGKYIAGICSAPAVVFEPHKLLEDPATCDPMHRSQMAGRYVDEKVVVHKNCITSQGPGTAIEFALKLVELLGGQKQCAKVEHEILYNLP